MARSPKGTKKSEDEILESAMARVQKESAPNLEKMAQMEDDLPAQGKRAASKPQAPKQKSAQITYTPLDIGDPPFTTMHGVRFEANKPKTVHHPDCIASAKVNPWFSVDGKQAKRVLPSDINEELDMSRRAGLPKGVTDEQMVETVDDD